MLVCLPNGFYYSLINKCCDIMFGDVVFFKVNT